MKSWGWWGGWQMDYKPGKSLDIWYLIPTEPRVHRGCTQHGQSQRPACLTLIFAFCPDVEWTEWFEHDQVSYTKGGEKISDLGVTHPGKICNRPIDIQVTKKLSRLCLKEDAVDHKLSYYLSGVSLMALL